MIGARIGSRIGQRIGAAIGIGDDPIAPLGRFNGFGIITFTSNGVGIPNFNASQLSDTTYGVSDVSGFAGCLMNRRYANSVADPPTMIDVADETLRAYQAPPSSNMGTEQTLGRRLFNRGMATNPYLCTFALSGSTTVQQRGDSTSPQIGGNLCARLIAYVNARAAAYGHAPDFTVVHTGENNTGSSPLANSVQADIANFASTYRAGIGLPNHLLYFVYNAATTGAFTATVKAQIEAYVASDPFARKIYVDDIPLAANPHYGANQQYDVGDRVCYQAQKDFFPGVDFSLEAASAFPRLQDWGAAITVAADPTTSNVRSGPDLKDGDAQLLVISSQATAATYAAPGAGFTAFGSGLFESVFSGTNHRSMAVYWRLVDQATLNANNGQMPVPTVDATGVVNNCAFILTFRGPNKWISNPFDLFVTGANNGNNTGLTIGGGTTAAANELAVILSSLATNATTVSSLTNAALSSITKRREAGCAGSTGTLGIAVHTARIATSGTVVGNNVGCLITLKP